MNKNIQKIFFLGLMVSSATVFSQIKEEQLILDRKREPEVKKIEKKKTSVETIKNYPPEEKSANPVNYDVTDVPAVSDFKTSSIQGSDFSPKFDTQYQNNFVRFGMGNFGKILGDANFSKMLENKVEIGGNAHFLSTKVLEKEYPWSSESSTAEIGAFLNHYGEKGKFNLNAQFDLDDYNYYGIYALEPASDVDLQQKTNQFKVNGYYDFYDNNFLNDVRVKSSFLSDHFDAKESSVSAALNLSKHAVELRKLGDVTLNGDLGIGLQTQQTDFSILNQNSANFFNFEVSPKVTFFKNQSYLMLGSDFSFLNSKNINNISAERTSNKTFWFPKAEILYYAMPQFQFYAGVDGGLKLNSFADFLQENPFVVSDQEIRATEKKYQIYFGLKGDIDQNIKYDVSAGYGKINNIMFFRANDLFDNTLTLNRSAYNFANVFSATYDNGNVSEIKGSLQYFPLANLALDAEINFQKFDLENYENIYNKPLLKASLGGKYTLLDKKLLLGAKAFFVSDRTTNSFEISNIPAVPFYSSVENTNDKVGGYADLNLSAEFKVHKNFSIFALGNNLLNTNYQTFKGYKVLGTQIVGGVKISF